MNQYADTQNSGGLLKGDYGDDDSSDSLLARALKKKREKMAENRGMIDQKEKDDA